MISQLRIDDEIVHLQDGSRCRGKKIRKENWERSKGPGGEKARHFELKCSRKIVKSLLLKIANYNF